jgi:large repetitive protein
VSCQGVERLRWYSALPRPAAWRRLLAAAVACAATGAAPLAAQLDNSCMVSALNRTAPVDASGVWLLPNVPADQGPLRVRATYVAADGTVRSG